MRRSFILAAVLGALLSPAPAAGAVTGGAAGGEDPGGAVYDPSVLEPMRIRSFAMAPGTVAPGAPAQVVVRVDGPVDRVWLRVDLLAPGTSRLVKRVRLGTGPTGRRVRVTWRPGGAALAPGDYTARLHVTGPEGQRPPRAARVVLHVKAPDPEPPEPAAPAANAAPSGRFPVQGPYTFGGTEGRFGAARPGHSHQGQDIVAAEGSPVISPLAGVVRWRAYQGSGAGHYLVIRAGDGRDLAFMHLRAGSLLVNEGGTVRAGARIAEVGSSGRSSGPHLHFEIWTGGWWEAGGRPVDPLPQLEAWARGES